MKSISFLLLSFLPFHVFPSSCSLFSTYEQGSVPSDIDLPATFRYNCNDSGLTFLVVLHEKCAPQRSRPVATCWAAISISFLCMSSQVHITRYQIPISSVLQFTACFACLTFSVQGPLSAVPPYDCLLFSHTLNENGRFLSEVYSLLTNKQLFLKQIQDKVHKHLPVICISVVSFS
jgi:hypothetical protein